MYYFWHQLTRVALDKGTLNWLLSSSVNFNNQLLTFITFQCPIITGYVSYSHLVAVNARLVHCFDHVSEKLVGIFLSAPAHVPRNHYNHKYK